MAMFQAMLDISAYNAMIIYAECNDNWPHKNKKHKRREFLKELGMELIRPQIACRERIPYAENASRLVHQIRDDVTPPLQSVAAVSRKRKRCFMCADDNKHSDICEICNRSICKKHSKKICIACLAE